MRRPPTAEIPDAPGSYLFRDRNGRVVYVGKAKSLRKRVGSYFSRDLHPRTQTMIDTAETVEWIVADSEVAALMLEYSLIKQHRPRFNVRLVDDKSYPYLAITRGDEWPRARVMRGAKRKPTEYFGPYAHAYAIRSTLDQLLRTFPVRTCSDGVFRRQQAQGRPCLLFHIEKCVGPCIGAVEPDRYVELVDGLAAFLRGDTDGIVEDLEKRMWDAAGREDFEQAARFRDRLEDVRRAIERQEMVTDRREDFDLLALHGDDLETSLQVLHVRRGRVVGRLGAMIDRVEELTDAELAESVIRDLYIDEVPPPLIVVAEEPADLEAMRVWLAERRGSAVEVRVPQRGAKRRLLENAQVNAREAFGRHRLKRQSDHNARARALRSLQEILELPEAPLRIEAFDISTLQGTNTVASMVVMEDGLPRRSDYRRFKIRTVEGQDDFASMEEVISRRFQNYLREMNKPVEEQTRFRYPPTLIVIDGGPAQLGRATKAMSDAGVSIPAIGLAKRLEEIYVPGQAEPIRIRRDAEALYLLQQIRDEAHRFAITYHRSIRSKSMLDSILDEVPGIGPTRKKALLKRFGSLIRLRDATEEEMASVIPTAVASQLYAALHGGHDGQEQ
jgi:excinuclease ABC subunit C